MIQNYFIEFSEKRCLILNPYSRFTYWIYNTCVYLICFLQELIYCCCSAVRRNGKFQEPPAQEIDRSWASRDSLFLNLSLSVCIPVCGILNNKEWIFKEDQLHIFIAAVVRNDSFCQWQAHGILRKEKNADFNSCSKQQSNNNVTSDSL